MTHHVPPTLRRYYAFTRGARLALVLTATVSTVRAESPGFEGGPPFFCTPAGLPSPSHTLPRNVPAVPLIRSSLADSASFLIVGGTGVINAQATTEYWNVAMGGWWLLRPAMEPPVGDYVLRYEELCSRTDAGAYEPRLHTVELPFRFTFDSPLPTSAGSLTVDQGISDEKPLVREVVTPDGVCQVQSFKWVKLYAVWKAAAELLPFIEAVQAVARRPNGAVDYERNYGWPVDSAPSGVAVVRDMINCYPPMVSNAGFVNGRGTYTFQSHLAGAPQDFPLLSIDAQLSCPLPEVVGPCTDAGADAGPDGGRDADTTDSAGGDGPWADVGSVFDGTDSVDAAPGTGVDASSGSLDARGEGDGPGSIAPPDGARPDDGGLPQDDSSARDAPAPSVDAASPPPPDDPPAGEDRGCSVSKVGAERSEPGGAWLMAIVMLAGAVLRRHFRAARDG